MSPSTQLEIVSATMIFPAVFVIMVFTFSVFRNIAVSICEPAIATTQTCNAVTRPNAESRLYFIEYLDKTSTQLLAALQLVIGWVRSSRSPSYSFPSSPPLPSFKDVDLDLEQTLIINHNK